MTKWNIGDVTITKILEVEPTMDPSFLGEGVTKEKLKNIEWLHPHFVDEDGSMKVSVHALVVDTPNMRILVDTCIGNDKKRDYPDFSNLQTEFMSRFEAAGFTRDSIDVVLCTHLHVDHVGWNTMLENGQWVPTFPKARYLFGRVEFEYWSEEINRTENDNTACFHDSVKPIWDAGLVELVETNQNICDEVSLEPTLGHTPGHVSVRIRSKGSDALISGDFTHHPCQFAHPEWASIADYDQQASSDTRRRVYGELAGSDTLFIGTHFPTPTAGNIVRDGEAFRLKIK